MSGENAWALVLVTLALLLGIVVLIVGVVVGAYLEGVAVR